ncbi:MAG: TSUP family transporter [Clostridia bacterium]|nr:TSUP family transporter [Clostridia bacterium]
MEKATARHEKLLLAFGAIGAGFLNGLLGAGGGIILYFVLGALYGRGAKENLVLSTTAVMFFCLISLFFYKGNAALTVGDILRVGIPAAAGGLIGALLLRRIPAHAMKKIFSALIVVSGILMLVRA